MKIEIKNLKNSRSNGDSVRVLQDSVLTFGVLWIFNAGTNLNLWTWCRKIMRWYDLPRKVNRKL